MLLNCAQESLPLLASTVQVLTQAPTGLSYLQVRSLHRSPDYGVVAMVTCVKTLEGSGEAVAAPDGVESPSIVLAVSAITTWANGGKNKQHVVFFKTT